MAVKPGPDPGPRDREQAVSAAYLRLTGHTQPAAAKQVGVGERTLRRWEAQDWWIEVEIEAQNRWLRGLAERTRAAMYGHVAEDAATARFVAERLFPELGPPAKRHELTGKDGGPLETTSVLVLPPVGSGGGE